MGIPEPTEEVKEQILQLKEQLKNGEITNEEATQRLEEILNEPIVEKG